MIDDIDKTAFYGRDLFCGVCKVLINHEVRLGEYLSMGMLTSMQMRDGMDAHARGGFTCDGGSTAKVTLGDWEVEEI